MSIYHTEKSLAYKKRLMHFMETEIYPREKEVANFSVTNPTELHPQIEILKEKAKAEGLWNLFMPVDYGKYSGGLTNVEYAILAEEMGKVRWASEVFNCDAPDTGNMEVFAKYGSEEHKEKYLLPLLDGKIRSCFLMTEPDVASSDARNVQTSIVRDGEDYVINGKKWWITNILHPNCEVLIVMGKTDPTASTYHQQSMVIVPRNHPGVEIIRDLPLLDHYDRPGGHCEVHLNNVRVPKENLILGEGRGFEIAQGRLGPGRIHHAMRLIGVAQRAFDYMCKRANERTAFGKRFSEMGALRQTVAKTYCEIQKARQLTLLTAYTIDKEGAKGAKDLIATLKISVIPLASKVIDDAMQVFGGKGMSNDIPLAGMYANSRAMRFADGPEEVHANQLGRNLLKRAATRDDTDTKYFHA